MAPAAADGRAFTAPVNFSVGTMPRAIAVADLNGDTKTDVVTANGGADNVSVLLGDGNGGFTGPTSLAAGDAPGGIAVGDLNGDTKPDLAVANALSNFVSIFIGDGTGGFAGPTSFVTDNGPVSVAIRDLNGDTKPDLAVANQFANNVSILLGNGSGGFSGRTNFAVAQLPFSIAAGNVNGDTKPDLAVATREGNVVDVLFGDGNGGFSAPSAFLAGTRPWSVAIGDLNGDTHQDLVVANRSSNNVSVLLGDGSGGFTGPTNFPAGLNPTGVAIDDLNGDTKPDLAVADNVGSWISVLVGNGTGGFGAPTLFSAGTSPVAIATAELNGDTSPDLVVANQYSDNVSRMLNVVPTITVNDVSGAEGNSGQHPFNFTVTLSPVPFEPTSVDVHTDDGTATVLDSDYAALPVQTINFTSNNLSPIVPVQVNGDYYYEGDDVFNLKLTNPVKATIADDTGVGTIQNDEGPGYPRPKDASPLRVPLVIAYNNCTAPNRTHGPPLGFDSCSPPVQRSQYLTVGTPDANGAGAKSVGSLKYSVIRGDIATPTNEADVALDLSITDVRGKVTLGDYIRELWTTATIRLTDRFQAPPQTATDFDFNWAIPCVATSDTTIGATCALNTTANAVVPGSVVERVRTIWEVGQVQVQDGGEDGVGSTTGDNTAFLKEGIFVP